MVYVDHMQASYRRMKMCHMLADSDEELHAMAERIGVARRHHQKPGTPHSHYDICRAKRKLAVKAGAIEITRSQLGALIRTKRTRASQAVGTQPSSQTTKGTAVPTPDLVTCPKDEYEAMCAVMATLDPATVPGLTVAQRCALGAFAKSHKADDARSSEVRILRGYVKDLEDTLDKIAVSLGVEGRRPELLIFKCGQVAEALQASSEDAARWRWIHPFLELESDFLYESGTARYSLIHLKGDQVDLPPSLYYKDVVAGVDAARALARKQNG